MVYDDESEREKRCHAACQWESNREMLYMCARHPSRRGCSFTACKLRCKLNVEENRAHQRTREYRFHRAPGLYAGRGAAAQLGRCVLACVYAVYGIAKLCVVDFTSFVMITFHIFSQISHGRHDIFFKSSHFAH